MKRIATVLAVVMVLACFTDATAARRPGHRPHYRYENFSNGLGFSFGYVHTAYRLSDWATDEVETLAGLNGFQLGLTKDFTLIDNALYLQTGLMYTYQNQNKNDNSGGVRIVGDWNEHYLSIPVKVKYEFPVLENLSVFVMAGPTVSEGLDSKIKYRATVGGLNAAVSYNCYNGKVRTNSDALDGILEGNFPDIRYRRFDVQVGASAGVRFFNIFEAQIGYDWGLINKYRDDHNDDLKLRGQQLYISVGMRF